MTTYLQANTHRYSQNAIEEVKKIISDLDQYMTPYEKGEYLRSFLGEDSRKNYLTLTKPWRKLWDGFYPAEEFTREFVSMYLDLLKNDLTDDKLAYFVYSELRLKIGQFEDKAWNARAEVFRAAQREAKYLNTGKI